MVALLENSPLPSKTALRARGATSSFDSRLAIGVKSSNRIELGRFTYDACRRLGLCSKVGIHSEAALNLFSYVGVVPTFYIDPSGLRWTPPTKGPHDQGHYTWYGWWAGLSPIQEYVYYHCIGKCPCITDLGERITGSADAAQEAIRHLTFDPRSYPDIFEVPTDFLSPEQVATGETPVFPSSLHYLGRAHSALRHCIWSGLMARKVVNCACAACVADSRDMFQYFWGETEGMLQGVGPTVQAIYNDREGRKCAGCAGIYADGTPGDTLGYPYMPIPNLSDGVSDIVNCCKSKLLRGQLATNITTPGVLPTLPPRPKPNSPGQSNPPIFIWPGVVD